MAIARKDAKSKLVGRSACGPEHRFVAHSSGAIERPFGRMPASGWRRRAVADEADRAKFGKVLPLNA
jgi:hypothetical protein